MRIAIDSGGTFTDCLFIRSGKLQILKVPSRPNAPAEAIAEAVKLAIENDSDQANLDLVCGTTVGTNALLERRGGRVALVTTAGFEDVLAIGRQARSKLYDLFVKKTEPLASLRFGVKERIAADGSVIDALNKREIARVLRKIKTAKPDSIALCFLFSFRNATHEKQLAAALRASNLFRLRLPRNSPRASRIRTHLHHSHQRLSRSGHEQLPPRHDAPHRRTDTRTKENQNQTNQETLIVKRPHHAIQWRNHFGRTRRARTGPHHPLRPRRRSHRRRPRRQTSRHRKMHQLRHGRHINGCSPADEGTSHHERSHRRRFSSRGTHAGNSHCRRRRRFHRALR